MLIRGLIFSALLGVTAMAVAHQDIWLTTSGNKLMTGEEPLGGDPFTPAYVFGMDLGEDPNDPYYSEDPGFDTAVGAFSAGSSIGFEFMRAVAKWNGSTFVNVANTFTASKAVGGTTLSATSGSGWAPGFSLDVASDGTWHEHFGWTLNGIGSANPETGVYRLAIRMVTSNTSLTASDEFWVIVNNGDTELNHDAAIDYAIQTVPEPATMTALGLAFGALAARKRRRK